MKIYRYTLWMYMLFLLVGTSCSESESTLEPEPEIPPKITIDSDSEFTVTDRDNQFIVSFTTNKEWTVSSNQSWCAPKTLSGGPGKISVPFIVEKNETYDSREAIVSILSGSAKQNIKVTQAQMDAIVIAKNSYEVEAEMSTLLFEVQSNVKFKVDTDVDWIKHNSDISRGLAIYKLGVVIEENSTSKQREGHILITKDNIKQIITVVQKECKPRQLIITHNLSGFVIPHIEGKVIEGQILWGDGQEEPYKAEALHNYDNAGSHTVVIKVKDPEGMSLKVIDGILSIDLSKF